ncbi:MAG: rRNA (adenine1518-N6/adenine1519-N6)-dimethyltransferase [Thermotogaceae bacterium]|nr:rRNA (adenine1518-N6/adenine1519-N6)-dimethyltransferase [Thermotogaceae bacterium]MDN5337147.1 rRNA (adenine1518-N6/adenine1519-N6)-dimethyltransferase [Thermotogaceae bacterium]
MKTSEWLAKYNVKLKKSLGQNFLSDNRIAKRIIEKLNLDSDYTIVEIGAGAGTLTEELARIAKKVIAYEVDLSLAALLRERLKIFENVEIKFEDFLKADLKNIKAERLSYVANIPYFITTPIIEKILLESPKFEFATLMVQKELAERIASKHGSRKFGSISFFVQYFCNVETVLEVSRSHFVPNPKVDSIVIKLTPKNPELSFEDLIKLFKFSKKLFSQRRKMIKNILKSMGYSAEKLESLDKKFDLKVRPEQLSVEQITELYNLLER